MSIINIEFKAKIHDLKTAEAKLLTLDPEYIGDDFQTDTYFNVKDGRLKLREGNIENALIWYNRIDVAEVRRSDILLYKHSPDKALKDILIKVHGIKTIVEKQRRIYFIDNVKFHFDNVARLGSFTEVEAIDTTGTIGVEKLKEQCNYYVSFFGIKQDELVKGSYSDMLLNKSIA
jgi:predicted adenylyl cyclase CyaB